MKVSGTMYIYSAAICRHAWDHTSICFCFVFCFFFLLLLLLLFLFFACLFVCCLFVLFIAKFVLLIFYSHFTPPAVPVSKWTTIQA